MQALATKGATAAMALQAFMAKLKWTAGADFDLAAVFERADSPVNAPTYGIVYFHEKGDINKSPFVALDKDAGVGDKAGANEETLRVQKLDGLRRLWLLCWDYGKVQKGEPARFAQTDVQLDFVTVPDDGNRLGVKLAATTVGNVAVVAELDNTNPISAKITNLSKTGTLNGLKDLSDLVAIIKG